MNTRSHLRVLLAAVAVVTIGSVSCGLAQDRAPADDQQTSFQRVGVKDYLPVFYKAQGGRLAFPYSWGQWSKRNGNNFNAWRKEVRARVTGRFLTAPPAAPSRAPG